MLNTSKRISKTNYYKRKIRLTRNKREKVEKSIEKFIPNSKNSALTEIPVIFC